MIENNVIEYGLNGAIYSTDKMITMADINRLENISYRNIRGTEIINTKMYIQGENIASEVNINEISDSKGVEPIVSMERASSMTGRCSVEISANDRAIDIEAVLNKGVVTNIITEEVEQVRQTLADKIENKFSSLRELLSPKSNEGRYEQSIKTVINSMQKFGYTEGIIESVIKGESRALTNILTKGVMEFGSEAEIKAEIENVLRENILTREANSYIEALLNRGRIYEAQGAIRGIVEIAVENEAISQWDNIGRSGEEIREVLREGKYRELREFMMIRGVQLMIAGENIREMFNAEIESDSMTTKEFLDSIMLEISKSKGEVLRANREKIQEIKTSVEKEAAIRDFKGLDPLFQEELRRQNVNREGISALAVRSIMSAA
jgi:hypothetical protein